MTRRKKVVKSLRSILSKRKDLIEFLRRQCSFKSDDSEVTDAAERYFKKQKNNLISDAKNLVLNFLWILLQTFGKTR